MTNPWDKYSQINDNVTQATSNNPWDLYQSNTPTQPTVDSKPAIDEQKTGAFTNSINNTINRVRNIKNIVGLGMNLLTGSQPSDEQEVVYNALKQGQLNATEGNQKAGYDIMHMFDNVNIKDSIKQLFGGIIGTGQNLIHDPSGTLNKGARTVLEMPGNLVEGVVSDVFGSMSGVALDGSTLRAYTPEEHAAKVKSLIANATAAAVAPAASKLISAGLGATSGLSANALENAPTQILGQIAAQPDKLGAIGRAIVSDAGAAVASGVTQGAIENANTPEVISGMATALLFAPIGVLSGWYRGVTNQGDAFTATRAGAEQIKMLRDWQEIGDANIEGTSKKVEKLLTSDKISEALGPNKVEGTVPNIDDLYNQFRPTLNNTDSFASTFVNFIEKNNLQDHTNELLEKFATKYTHENVPAEEMDHLRNLVKDNRAAQKGPFNMGMEHDLLTEANRRGFFYTNEFGALKIRDIETGETIATAKNSKEAMEFLKSSGNPANPLLMDANSSVPSIGIPSTPIAPHANPHPFDDWEPLKNNPTALVAGLDIGMLKPLTAMNGFVEAVDRLNDTNLKHSVFEPLEKSNRLTNVAIHDDLMSGRIKLIDAFVRSGKNKVGFASRFAPEDLEAVGMAMEAQSWDEMVQPNGYAKGYTIPQESQALAKFMHENNVDANKVLYYRRATAAARSQASLAAQQKAAEQYKFNINHLDGEEATALYKKAVDSFEQSPAYMATQAQIEGSFKPDANFMKAVGMYDDLFKMPDGSAHAGAATRLKLALDLPDTHGVSQADFIKNNNFTSDQTRLLGMLEEAYEHFGNKFGISDSRKFIRYMNHYRQYGDILDSYVVGDFERGIMDGSMRNFASTMIRTGEVANFSMNPVANLQAYIRAGNKSQILYPELTTRLNDIEATIGKELDKIKDPVMRNMVVNRFNDYQRDISGRGSMSKEEAMHVQASVLKELVVNEDDRRMTTQEIIREMQRPDKADALLSLSSAGLLGGRVSLAFRDNYDVWQKFFIKHGSKRLWNLLTTRVNDSIIDDLVSRGEITRPSAQDVYNVVASQGTTGAFNNATRELAEFGFKTSLQGHYYMKNQAAVWLETTRNTNKVLGELSSGALSKEKAYSKLFLNSYDIPTQRTFNALVQDGQNEAASRLLAGQEVRSVVGTFARGNQAPVLNSTPGKFLGQLGSWSMTNRSVFENMMTRGTNAEIARSMARYATTVAGTMVAGRATGLNLGQWLLLPTSFIATGGPVVQAIKSVGGDVTAELGGNEAQIKYARRQALTSLTQFIPMSYMVGDVKKAAKLASDGYGYGVARPLAQAVGIGVNAQQRNVLDLVQGNYPIAPDVAGP